MEPVCIKHDNGRDIAFTGRLFSECSWFDEDTGTLTRQKLYVTADNDHVYHIVRSSGKETSRHAYRLAIHEDNCVIFNGRSEVTLQFDQLMLSVRKLCGMDVEGAVTSAEMDDIVEPIRAAANS
jgi:hypothetical protein